MALVTLCPMLHLQSSHFEPSPLDVQFDKHLNLKDGFCCCLQQGESEEPVMWAAKHPPGSKNTLQEKMRVES